VFFAPGRVLGEVAAASFEADHSGAHWFDLSTSVQQGRNSVWD